MILPVGTSVVAKYQQSTNIKGIKLTISEENKVVVVKVTTTKAAPDTTQ